MKRKPRHSRKAVEQMRARLKENGALNIISSLQLSLTEEQVQELAYTHGGVFIRRGYDLRGPLEEKVIDCSNYAKWTAFVNVAHTLVHLVPREGDFHVRIPLYATLKNFTDANLAKVIIGRFWRD